MTSCQSCNETQLKGRQEEDKKLRAQAQVWYPEVDTGSPGSKSNFYPSSDALTSN